MIHCYFVCCWILDYAQRSLDSILENATEPLEITVVENYSPNSNKFIEWGKQLVIEGKIKRFIHATENAKGKALMDMFRTFPPNDSENFVVFSDLDVLFQERTDWVAHVRWAMKDNNCCGWALDPINYVPPNSGWKDGPGFGNYLMGLNIERLKQYPQEVNFQDYIAVNLMQQNKGRVVQIPIRLYHMGWDAWKDAPDYWEYKINTFDWQSKSNPEYIVYEMKEDESYSKN